MVLWPCVSTNSKVSRVLGRDEGDTCSSPSQWPGHSKHSNLSVCHCKTAALSVQVHIQTFTKEMGQSCFSAQAQPGRQEKPGPTPHLWLTQGVPSAVRNRAPEGHPGSPAPSPSLTPSLQGMLYVPITEESHLLDGAQTCSPRSPKVDGQHAGSVFSSSSPCRPNAEQWSPYSPSTSALNIITSLPPHLAREGGRSQELAASHQKAPSVHGDSTEQVPQVHGSRSRSFCLHPEAGRPVPPSALPLETFTAVQLAQQSLSSQYSVGALSTQPRVPSEAREQQRIRPVTFCFSILQSLLNCSAFNNPYPCLVPHFQTWILLIPSIKLTRWRVLFLKYIF